MMEHVPDPKVLVEEVKTTISYIEVFLLFLGAVLFWSMSIIIINAFTLVVMGSTLRSAFFLGSEHSMPFTADEPFRFIYELIFPIVPWQAILSTILLSIIPIASLIIYLLVITHALRLDKRKIFFSCASLAYVPVIFAAYAVLMNVITYNLFRQVSYISLILYPLLGLGALLYLLSKRIEEIHDEIRGFMSLVFPWLVFGVIAAVFLYLAFIKDYSILP